MKVSKATNSREGVHILSGGRDYFVTAKHGWLQVGCAMLLGVAGAPYGDAMDIPGYGPYDKVVTDALLVCLARRGFSGRNNEQADGEFVTDIDIPTYAEAVAELSSGVDKYGGQWESPKVPHKVYEIK